MPVDSDPDQSGAGIHASDHKRNCNSTIVRAVPSPSQIVAQLTGKDNLDRQMRNYCVHWGNFAILLAGYAGLILYRQSMRPAHYLVYRALVCSATIGLDEVSPQHS